MNDPARYVILVISPSGSPLPECEERLRVLETRGYSVWRARGSATLDTMRSRLATEALGKGFDELMWIAGDIVFDPNDVDRLRGHNLPIVGGLITKTTGRQFDAEFRPGTDSVSLGRKGGLFELRYLGLGFLHTRREVYERIARQFALPVCNERLHAPLVPYFWPMMVPDGPAAATWYLDGDFAFGERAKQCGFRSLADTRMRLWHVGSFPYSWEETREPIRGPDFSFNVHPAKNSAPSLPTPQVQAPDPRQAFRGHAKPLAANFPRLKAYVLTYPANAESAQLTLDNIRQSDWGEEPTVFVQPSDWPMGKASASNNYKRALERAAADGCDFALLLEDDVRVCKHLRHNLENLPLVHRDQCDYLSLFMPDLMSSPWERQETVLGYRLARPLYSGPNRMWEKYRIWGSQAYFLSRRFIRAALQRWDRLTEGQDSRIISVCSELKLPMWYTAPCLVQHAPLRTAFSTPATYAADFREDFQLRIAAGFQPPEEVPGWLTHEEGKLLWEMASDKEVLELGTAYGRSTVCMAQSARRVVSYDLQDQSEASEWLRRFGLSERVTLHQMDLGEWMQPLEDGFDMAFIDTGHDAPSVARDIDIVLEVLEPGGLIAFHDYPDPAWPDVRRVVDDYARRFGWKRIAQAEYLGVFETASPTVRPQR